MVHRRTARIVKFFRVEQSYVCTHVDHNSFNSSIEVCRITSRDRFGCLDPCINILIKRNSLSIHIPVWRQDDWPKQVLSSKHSKRTKAICSQAKINIANVACNIRVHQIQVFPWFCIRVMIDLAFFLSMFLIYHGFYLFLSMVYRCFRNYLLVWWKYMVILGHFRAKARINS